MAFTIGSASFSGKHGRAVLSPFEAPVVRTSYSGSRGIVELQDEIKSRRIAINYLVTGASAAALNTALETLHSQSGQVAGTLTIDSTTFRNCKFIGFGPDGRPFNDAVSGNWLQRGTILVEQLNYYAL